MEMKLNIYKDRKCKEVEKTLIANDFRLGTGVCEDVLRLVKVDQFDDLTALSDESQLVLVMNTVTNNLGTFKNILKDIFDDVTDDELERTAFAEITAVVMQIVEYSLSIMFSTFISGKRQKN